MKKISLIIYSLLITFSSFSQALTNPVLIEIDGKEVSKEEFQRIYNKNKSNLTTGEVTPVDEYLDLFINFKLKVFEAEKLGLDTGKVFKNEFEGYKKQLASPYLIDKKVNEDLIKEAYERMQFEVRASHILVKIPNEGYPEDTLEAYTTAMEIRRRIIAGEPFESVAKSSSNDPSVKNNGGDLGYFTVFQMIYPFETAVYNSEIGNISKPVRTKFGYHIVKLTDKQKASGQIKVAHIMLTVPRGTSPEVENQKKQLINEIYHKVKQGNDFNDLAKEYSNDRGSAKNGGELPWFGVGRMVPEFEKASFELKSNGEVSQPIRTAFGWHLIKRLDRKEIQSFEESLDDITRKVSKDQRSEKAHKSFINNLKTEYNFVENVENVPVKYDTIENAFILKQEYLTTGSVLNKTLFSFLNKDYLEKDFSEYLKTQNGNRELKPYGYLLLYNEFINKRILHVENSRLDKKYPEYKYLLREYHDGMLLFEITDQVVWSKAVSDTVGLKDFYNRNKKNYMWDERWDGTLYYCSNETVYKKVKKIVNKGSFGKKVTNNDLIEQFNKETEVLRIETGLFEKGENEVVDFLVWNKRANNHKNRYVYQKGSKVNPVYKDFDECKGLVISDYQDFLDKEWIRELREKYSIQVNKAVLSTIK